MVAGDLSPPVTTINRTSGAGGTSDVATPSEKAGSPGTVPANGLRVMRVLYLFAGARRKSGLARSLRIACKGKGILLTVDEVDVLRGGRRHDLSRKSRQLKIQGKI